MNCGKTGSTGIIIRVCVDFVDDRVSYRGGRENAGDGATLGESLQSLEGYPHAFGHLWGG